MASIPRVCQQDSWFSVAFRVSETLSPQRGLHQGFSDCSCAVSISIDDLCFSAKIVLFKEKKHATYNKNPVPIPISTSFSPELTLILKVMHTMMWYLNTLTTHPCPVNTMSTCLPYTGLHTNGLTVHVLSQVHFFRISYFCVWVFYLHGSGMGKGTERFLLIVLPNIYTSTEENLVGNYRLP